MNIETLRLICLALPFATEDIKWGTDLTFLIGGKMFCVTGLDGNPVGISIKVKDEEFEFFIAKPGFIPAPYLARYKWVYLDDITRLSDRELKEYIRISYELIKSKLPAKKRKELT